MTLKKCFCVFLSVIITTLTLVIPAGAATDKIAAPENLTAVSKSETSVKLTWGAVNNADSYIVYCSTEKAEGFKAYGKVTKNSATVKGLTTGTKYYFRVKAVQTVDGKKTKSAYSKAAAATPKKKQTVSTNDISVVQEPGDVQNGKKATLTIKGKPNTEYFCVVYYDTINGTAKGIGSSVSDSEGYASWTWKVGTKTNVGNHPIGILENGAEIRVFEKIFYSHKKNS